jgi:hypothetical protein
MEDLVSGDLKIAISNGDPGAAMELHWTGKSNDRQPVRVLAPFFRAVLDHAAAHSQGVAMHFERIDHFNSSTVTAIIQLIHEARRRSVALELVYDAKLRWQKMSFDALKMLTEKDTTVRLRSV